MTADSDLDIALGLDPTRLSASLLHDVIHEFGHVFDGRARKHGRFIGKDGQRHGRLPTDLWRTIPGIDRRRLRPTSS